MELEPALLTYQNREQNKLPNADFPLALAHGVMMEPLISIFFLIQNCKTIWAPLHVAKSN